MNIIEKIKLTSELVRLAKEKKAITAVNDQGFFEKVELNKEIHPIREKLGLVVNAPKENKKRITFTHDILVIDGGKFTDKTILLRPGCDYYERLEKVKELGELGVNKVDYANIYQALIDTQAEYGEDENGNPCVYVLPEFKELKQLNLLDLMLARWKGTKDGGLSGVMYDILSDIDVELPKFKSYADEVIIAIETAVKRDKNDIRINMGYGGRTDDFDLFLAECLAGVHIPYRFFQSLKTAKRFVDTLKKPNPFTNPSLGYLHKLLKDYINYVEPDKKECTVYEIESRGVSDNLRYFNADALFLEQNEKGFKATAQLAAEELGLSEKGDDLVCFIKDGEAFSKSALAEMLTPVQKAKIYTGWVVDRRVWDHILKGESDKAETIKELIERYELIAKPI